MEIDIENIGYRLGRGIRTLLRCNIENRDRRIYTRSGSRQFDSIIIL